MVLFIDLDKAILKFVKKHKRCQKAKILGKKNKVGGFTDPNVKKGNPTA